MAGTCIAHHGKPLRQPMEVGARRIYVMDEYGDTVLVDDWGHSWY
jgi:hypothetical protein